MISSELNLKEENDTELAMNTITALSLIYWRAGNANFTQHPSEITDDIKVITVNKGLYLAHQTRTVHV